VCEVDCLPGLTCLKTLYKSRHPLDHPVHVPRPPSGSSSLMTRCPDSAASSTNAPRSHRASIFWHPRAVAWVCFPATRGCNSSSHTTSRARPAAGSRGPARHHPGAAGQYTSADLAAVCRELRVRQSMGAVGTGADAAAAEMLNAKLKRETLQGAKCWPSARAARLSIFAWITRYNTRRRHSSLNCLSPINYEQRPDGVLLTA
jgi:transposase InsO family protein